MTRYTFALLVCRTVGILGLLTLLGYLANPLTHFVVRVASQQRSTPQGVPFEGFSVLAACVALGLPVAAVLIGLAARPIARKYAGDLDIDRSRTAFALAALISWYQINELCEALYRTGLSRWWQGRIFNESDGETGKFAQMLGIYPGDVARRSEELAFVLVAIAVLAVVATNRARLSSGLMGGR